MIRALLQFRNLDSTRDINDRLSQFIKPGIVSGGQLVPVPAQLKVSLTPWKLMSLDGMAAEETSDTAVLDVVAGQTTIIAIRAVYVPGDKADIQPVAIEQSTFNALPNRDHHIIVGVISLPASATQVLTSNIDYSTRDEIDPLGRNPFRGIINSVGALPISNNVLGDLYEIVDGIGGPPNLYGWNGSQWQIMTDVISLAATLNAHRANLLVDEKHLSDDQYAAAGGAAGTGSSGLPVNAANMYVDELDPRLPTLNENNALAGSDGNPSDTNRYITQAFILAVPTEKAYATPSNSYLQITNLDGNQYVGTSGVGSATAYFKLYDNDPLVQREYQTTTFETIDLTGVFTDAGLTNELDPASDPNVDDDGFFNGSALYIGLSAIPDSNLRLAYGRRQTLKTFPIDSLLRRSIEDAQTSTEVQQIIQNISGRPFTETPPVNEQNIELRDDIKNIKEYSSTVLRADNVVSNFKPASNVPEFAGDFEENVGIPPNYSFENTGLVAYTYAAPTVTYAAAVVLGSVVAGHVFIDGAGIEYIVTAIGVNQVNITKRDGVAPTSIDITAPVLADDSSGSIKPDNNPRKINLSDFDYITFRDRIAIKEIEVVTNEFHPDTGDVAYQIRTPIRSEMHREPRLRLYGAAENAGTINSDFRITAGARSRILVTGFFTDLYLLADVGIVSPPRSVTVYVDNSLTPVTTLDLGNTTNASFSTAEFHRQSFAMVSNLADGVPHTVELVFSTTGSDVRVYGVDLIRRNTAAAYTLPGRLFAQTDLYKNDAIVVTLPPVVPSQNRGAAYTRYVNRSLALTAVVSNLADVDGPPNSPAGTAVSGSPTFGVTSGVANLATYYSAGDVVRLQGATAEQVLLISSILGATVTFTTNVNFNGIAILFHMGSTTAEEFDSFQEYARYTPDQFGIGGFNDFSPSFSAAPATRSWTLEDGITSLAGVNLLTTSTGIDGYNSALLLNDAAATLRIRALATKIDILVANQAVTTITYSVDGSPVTAKVASANGLKRITLLTNGRYQTHDILITNSAGLAIAAIILHEPASPAFEGTALGTTNVLANYVVSQSSDGTIIPVGAVANDAFTSLARYVKGTGTGTDWAETIDAVNAPLAKYVTTDREGSYIQFEFFGEGFECEYVGGPDRGINLVLINGLVANNSNFVANFVGMNTAAGTVDMYAALATRKRFGVVSLPYGRYVVQVQVQTPRAKNVASTDWSMNVCTIYTLNTNGANALTPSYDVNGQVLLTDSVRDVRRFDPGNVVIQTVPQIRTTLPETRDDYITIGFDVADDFVCTGSADDVKFTAALAQANASSTARKVVVKPGTYSFDVAVAVPSVVLIEGWGTPTINDGGGGTAFQMIDTDSTIHNLAFGVFSAVAVDVNGQTGIHLTDCRGVTVSNAVTGDTWVTPIHPVESAVVGTAAHIKAGQATYTSLQQAINDVSTGGKIIVLAVTVTENITLNKTLTIIGQGFSSQVVGTWTFGAASQFSLVRDLGISGLLTFIALSRGNKFEGYQNTASTFVDHGIDNENWLIDQ